MWNVLWGGCTPAAATPAAPTAPVNHAPPLVSSLELDQDMSPRAASLLRGAMDRAAMRGDKQVSTDDLFWSLQHPCNLASVSALPSHSGKDAIWAVHLYSENVRRLLADAQEKAAVRGRERMGTEDLLDALSRAASVQGRLVAKEQDAVWGVHKYSEHVREVMIVACERAKLTKLHAEGVVGTEDLLWALFNKPFVNTREVHTSNKVSNPKRKAVWGLHQFTPSVNKVLDQAQEMARIR